MDMQKNILIVKHGALGDVVRTSFFAKPLRMQTTLSDSNVRLYWLTSLQSAPLLRFNPYIDVVATDPTEIKNVQFDETYSLDDEDDVLANVAKLNVKKIIGARLSSESIKEYCDRSASWFDMGLLSRHGKKYADKLKKLNNRSHSDIFKTIFQIDDVDFSCYNSDCLNDNMYKTIQCFAEGKVPIGLNAFAGKRWPSKALPDKELPELAQNLSSLTINGKPVHLFLIGSGQDLIRNQDFVKSKLAPKNITVLDTDGNILDLVAAVRSLKLLVTTDSLCLHLAVGQQIPTVAFFAPTSAAEIENLSYIRKLKSLSDDYCNYKPNADNFTITSERIMFEVGQLLVAHSDD
jgi:heptosyltransferase-2